MGNALSRGYEPIIPTIKFRHVTISQAGCVCVASRPSLVVICLKKFRKEFVVLEGRGPGARDNTKVIMEPGWVQTLGPLPLPAGLHLCSVVSRLSQLRHKYFPFHIAQIFLIEYYFIFGYLTWCWRTIEFIFIPVEKIIEGRCIWILFQISLNSIIRSGKTYLEEQETILITIYRF